MARWFDFDETPSTEDDLPWMKDYVPSVNYMLEGYEVLELYPGDKGILLITPAFKAFLFKREKAYFYLLEALSVWELDPTLPCQLIIQHNKSGKVRLGIDENNDNYTWILDGKRYVRKGKRDDTVPLEARSNPLLPPSRSHTHAQESRSTSVSNGTSDFQNPSARRGKKAGGV